MDGDTGLPSFLGRRLPPGFELRVVTIAPGCVRPYDDGEWRDALVVVEQGEIELESLGGTRRRLPHGAVLWLAGLPLRALHNPGAETALLAAVSRRPGTTDEFPPGFPSERRDGLHPPRGEPERDR
jgi:quercetin dioxygenase-like cupin family protein